MEKFFLLVLLILKFSAPFQKSCVRYLSQSQKRPTKSFKLNTRKNDPNFGEVASTKPRIRNFLLTLATSNFQLVVLNRFQSKSSWVEIKSVFSKEVCHKKKTRGK